MKKVLLLLAEGFEEVEAVTPADFLRRSAVDLVLVGVTGKKVRGAHNISVECDVTVDEFSGNFDGIVIPGGMPGASNIAASTKAMNLITEAFNREALVAAICAAPAVVLGSAGLIAGRKFTCYPGFEKRFSGSIHLDERVVVDKNLITSKGPGTAAEFSEALIEYLCGRDQRTAIHEGTIQK